LQTESVARERLQRVFRFLQALDQHRNPVRRQVSDHSWVLKLYELPMHHTVSFTYPRNTISDSDVVFRIRRPNLSPCPEPPYSLVQWLEPQWQEPFKKSFVKKSIVRYQKDGTRVEEALSDNLVRKEAYEKWIAERNDWADKEVPARQAAKIFELVYELHGQIQKEGERIEIVLGDGILNWRRKDGGIHYPLILQRLQLVFHPEIPQFEFVETEQDPELYTALFQAMEGIDGSFFAEYQSQLSLANFHPLEGENTSVFLTKLVNRLSARGKFVGVEPLYGEEDEPRVGRAPIIFVRRRTAGFANTLQKIIETIPRVEPDMESALMNVLGIGAREITHSRDTNMPVIADDVLLGKHANTEQIQIAKTIDKYPGVLVQGPPGTGKTHTIANLIGHFLALGKTVLVTSHTTKALRVLRDKMVLELQPLCVSVLDNDSEGRNQLQRSVQGIIEKLSTLNEDSVTRKIEELEQHREKLVTDIETTRHTLLRARADEYVEIVIGDHSFSPSEAARFVSDGVGKHDWIPGPVLELQPISLTTQEVVELYMTNSTISSEDEIELAESIPKRDGLPLPSEFEVLANSFSETCLAEKVSFPSHWVLNHEYVASEKLARHLRQLEVVLEPLVSGESWKIATLYAGLHKRDAAWKKLVEHIQNVVDFAVDSEIDFARYQPEIETPEDVQPILKIIDDIITYLDKNNSFGYATLWLKPAWKKLITSTKVAGYSPSRREHFQALKKKLLLKSMRTDLVCLWDSLMRDNGAPDLRESIERPEDYAYQFCSHISHCLRWHGDIWMPFVDELRIVGVQWDSLFADQTPCAAAFGDIVRLSQAACGPLLDILTNLKTDAIIREIKHQQTAWGSYVREYEVPGKSNSIVNALLLAIERFDIDKYSKILQRIYELEELNVVAERRRKLIHVLSMTAPQWADAVEKRLDNHGLAQLPGDVINAWNWLQLKQELNRRHSISIEALQKKTETLNEELQTTTNALINLKAWYYQRKRTGLKQQQALIGYADTMRKIGAGTGKRVPQLRAQAMELIKECRQAVPVWIMSIARVVETFDPAVTKFDVVIIDEASQCDVMGLIMMYLAKKVIIVGDHEQVSPLAIGQQLDIVTNLINQHLVGVPLAKLYDGQTSIYDLARASFGGLICLTEHFRCVPDIIQFSNYLSYEGKIKPLRDSNSTSIHPATISHYVPNARSYKKVNLVEAEEIVKIITAASKLKEYEGKTFGVITLLGEEQAIEIERRLRQALSVKEFDERKLICGTAAHFQGDERDIMFLSVVEGPPDKPPLRILSNGHMDMYKKRYNVAASRARDQLWVIHSLQPAIDLQPNDLRRKLIQFAENPATFSQDLKQGMEKTDSGFERDVIRRLRQRGYRVTPQWKVGHYRIDIVVEGGNNQKLAIECDGDRYHPIEKLQEDMMRQAVLERLGWRFVRIRGSRYYQDPEEALIPVWERLAELEIEPLVNDITPNTLADEKILYYKVLEAAGITSEIDIGLEDDDESESVITIASGGEELPVIKSLLETSSLSAYEDINLELECIENESADPTLAAVIETVDSKDESTNVPPERCPCQKENHWIYSTTSEMWLELSHWGKKTEKLTSWDRKFAYDIGLRLSKKWELTEKQILAAERLYNKVVAQGFKTNVKK